METQRLLVVVLLLCVSQTQAEVVHGARMCKQFFLDEFPPNTTEYRQAQKGQRYKMICQTYKNQRTFFTLYDTELRIPVYSAFKFTGTANGSPTNNWMIEPQLEDKKGDKKGDKNMEDSDRSTVYQNQAGYIDYQSADRYNRGHLFPDSYGNSPNARQSTYTLTNIVPQDSSFNSGSWARMEESVKKYITENCININDMEEDVKTNMTKYCINNDNKTGGYVVTGAVPSELKPGKESGSNLLKNRVNIPSMMWSAFCCRNSKSNQWFSGAYMGYNIREGENKNMIRITLNELQEELNEKIRSKKPDEYTQLFKPPGCYN